MCGRTACALAPDDVIKACSYKDRHGKYKQPSWIDAPGGQQYSPAHNVAPGAFTPVLLSAKHLSTKTAHPASPGGVSDRVVMPMKWGLVPPWHQGDPFKVPYETNNCRAEGMLEKKTYKVPLMRGNRCIILADGFFEWKSSKDGKQPYYFYFPQDHLKSCSVKNEVFESPNEKIVKTEKVQNMRVIYEDKKAFDSDLLLKDHSNEVYLKASDCKSYPASPENNKIMTKACLELKREVDYTGDKSFNSKWCSEQDRCGDSWINTCIDNTSISQKCFVKQEACEGSWTDIDIKTKNETGFEVGEAVITSWKGHRLLTMAGVFDVWKADENAPPLYSYSVITVSSSRDMDWCHHRMPAILSTEEEVQNWLDFSSLPLSKAALLIKPKICLTHHAVSKQVNNSRYQAEDSVKPVQIGQQIATPGSKLMQQWLQSASPGKRKSQDSGVQKAFKAGGNLSQGSVAKKKKEKGGESLMMKWLKSGSPVKKT